MQFRNLTEITIGQLSPYTMFTVLRTLITALFIVLLTTLLVSVHAQVAELNYPGTVTTNQHYYGPLYKSFTTSSFTNSNYVYHYDAAELSSIPPGSTIDSIAWKLDPGNTAFITPTAGNTFTIDLQETTAPDIPTLGNTWNAVMTAPTQVFNNGAYGIGDTDPTGWQVHEFSTSFTYNGGNLLIGTTFSYTGGQVNDYIEFESQPVTGKGAGAAGGTVTTASTFSTLYDDNRPSIRIDTTQHSPASTSPITASLPPALICCVAQAPT